MPDVEVCPQHLNRGIIKGNDLRCCCWKAAPEYGSAALKEGRISPAASFNAGGIVRMEVLKAIEQVVVGLADDQDVGQGFRDHRNG